MGVPNIGIRYELQRGEPDESAYVRQLFVNPEAWRTFQASGTWPDKTVFLLEVRGAESKGSINKKGSFQGTAVIGLEAHVKDQVGFAGKWAFFQFSGGSG